MPLKAPRWGAGSILLDPVRTLMCLIGSNSMDEGRKRVLAIVAGILVARHLKTTEDLFDTRDSPRTRSMVIAAVQWAKRIMGKVDEECGR
jgi:hypothetical protein